MLNKGPNLRSSVLEAKEYLKVQREKLRERHNAGSPGIQVCNAATDVVDQIVLDLFNGAVKDLGQDLSSQVALVAHGGYGRREMAPYSDVDMMILCHSSMSKEVIELSGRMLRDIGDVGLVVGHSVRTVAEALSLAKQEPMICTSQMESRFLVGNQQLFDTFKHRFQRQCNRNFNRLNQAFVEARTEERTQYGETVHLLRPNVKRSRGALRELHLLRWIGYARYGAADPELLKRAGHLSSNDYRSIRDAQAFLLRLRNEIHFHARRAQDMLDKPEQMRIAELFGYEGDLGLLPVERFMQDYFRQTEAVSQIVSHFLEGAQPNHWQRTVLSGLFSHRMGQDFLVGPYDVRATKRGMKKVQSNLGDVLRLVDLANQYDKPIEFETAEAIRHASAELSDECTPEVKHRFLSLLDHPVRLGALCRQLHQMGILEKIIPEFSHARNLMQFNEYHKYTIDEHSLLAVEKAAKFHLDEGQLGKTYRQIKQKKLLHLALLLHDLGKGFEEDHSEVGARIAESTAKRLGLSPQDEEILVFLVHKHLRMAHIAFRRDINDHELLIEFAVEVGSPEVLQMLYLLTAADISAVGPGVWNDWKASLLNELYYNAMQHLSVDHAIPANSSFSEAKREEVKACLKDKWDAWFQKAIDALSMGFLDSAPAEQIAELLTELHELPPQGTIAHARYVPETETLEYSVATRDSVTPGVFHKLAGAFSAKGLQILSADIYTLNDGLVLDRFWVKDGDYSGEPPEYRTEEIEKALVKALAADSPPPVPKPRRYGQGPKSLDLHPLPIQVKIDNRSSEAFTIIDIFTADRPGLLYHIGASIFEQGLSVEMAKIGTYLDQVVDVFYVTDLDGNKIEDEERLEEIRSHLKQSLDVFETQHKEQNAVKV